MLIRSSIDNQGINFNFKLGHYLIFATKTQRHKGSDRLSRLDSKRGKENEAKLHSQAVNIIQQYLYLALSRLQKKLLSPIQKNPF